MFESKNYLYLHKFIIQITQYIEIGIHYINTKIIFFMKKIKFISLILLVCTPLFFISCDDLIDDFTTFPVELGDVQFDIPLELVSNDSPAQSSQLRNANYVSFSGNSGEINLQSDMFKTLGDSKYQGGAITLLVDSVKIRIGVTDKSGKTVSNFTSITAIKGSEEEFTYSEDGPIDMGKEFSNAELTKYMKDIFAAIQNNKTVSIDVAGVTNIVPSEIEGVDLALVTIIPYLKAEIKLTKK